MVKPNKDPSRVKNLRALQLTSVLDRIFQKVITWRIITYFYLNGFWDSGTCAYLCNRSIEDVTLTQDEDMYQTLAKGGVMNYYLMICQQHLIQCHMICLNLKWNIFMVLMVN